MTNKTNIEELVKSLNELDRETVQQILEATQKIEVTVYECEDCGEQGETEDFECSCMRKMNSPFYRSYIEFVQPVLSMVSSKIKLASYNFVNQFINIEQTKTELNKIINEKWFSYFVGGATGVFALGYFVITIMNLF